MPSRCFTRPFPSRPMSRPFTSSMPAAGSRCELDPNQQSLKGELHDDTTQDSRSRRHHRLRRRPSFQRRSRAKPLRQVRRQDGCVQRAGAPALRRDDEDTAGVHEGNRHQGRDRQARDGPHEGEAVARNGQAQRRLRPGLLRRDVEGRVRREESDPTAGSVLHEPCAGRPGVRHEGHRADLPREPRAGRRAEGVSRGRGGQALRHCPTAPRLRCWPTAATSSPSTT